MTRDICISLIAAAALLGMATLSIAGAIDGRIAFDDQPDAMVTHLYAFNTGAHHGQDAVLAGSVVRPGHQVPR